MSNKFYDALARSDKALARKIRSEHSQWFTTIETALDQVIQGLNEFGKHKGEPQGELESARLFLATHTFRNLRLALGTLERGYYHQSLGLARMAMEDTLVAEDIETCPETLRALLFDEGKLGRGTLSYQEMADRISEQAGDAWRTDYGDVSKYGAHPRMKALESSVMWDDYGKSHLSLASFYDAGWVAACCVVIAGESVKLIGIVTKLLHGTASHWVEQAYPAFAALEALTEDIRTSSEN